MSKRIVICDDEEGIRESLKLVLGDFFDLVLTNDGNQCLEAMEHTKDVGIVFLDIKMPQVNGLEILKQIKAKQPGVKVIIITGYKSVETAAEAVRLGASGYIVKPFKADEILAVARKHIKQN